MHHDEAGEPAGREQHDRHEEQPEIELPRRRVVAEAHLQPGDRDRAEDRAEIMRFAADVDHQQHAARARGADRIGGDDLVVDRVQAAGESREHRGDRKRR